MEKEIIKKKLHEAEEKLQLLKTQCSNPHMDIRTTLELASMIRNSISQDKDVTEICNTNQEYALLRKNLLDEIRKTQLELIAKHTKKYNFIGDFNCSVKDFDKAKMDLVEMIEVEQALHLFSDTESPNLFDSINESKKHEKTLQTTLDICKNEKYEVLVMGDFQAGKSTTIDAMCDGRHISAIGKGIATSAVLVSVTYADKERVEIQWRTKKQLKKIIDKIGHYFPNYDLKNFDLDSPQAREELASIIYEVRTSKECPNVSEGDAKFLMLCDFILKHYGTDLLAKKIKEQQSSSDPAEITKFPDKFETTWKKKGVDGFTIDEVLFIFIERVNCFVRSETLRRLNCTLTDSPGLFSSAYDTMVTENAMVSAHAIMFVLTYEKGMSEDACKLLNKIKEDYKDVSKKLFIVNNVKPGNNEIFNSNCTKVKDIFGEEKNVYRYDAKLAYLLQIKKLSDSGLASEKDYRHLMSVTEKGYDENSVINYNIFDEAWCAHINDYASTFGGKFLRILNGDIEEGLNICHFTDMTNALRSFIEDNKAYAVIVSNGLKRMTEELISVRNSLYRRNIESYVNDQETNVRKFENRIKNAKEFQSYVSRTANDALFGNQEGESLCSRIAEQEYVKLFTDDFFTGLSKIVAAILYDNKAELIFNKTIFQKEEYKKKFTKQLTPLIQIKIQELINQKINYLYGLLESEQDITVRDVFTPEIKNLETTLEKEWSSLYKDDENMHNMREFLNIPKSLKLQHTDDAYGSSEGAGLKLKIDNKSAIISGLVAEISSLVVGISSMIAGYIAAIFWDPTGISQTTALLISLLLGLSGTAITIFVPDAIRNQFISNLSKKILPEIKNDKTKKGFKNLVYEHMNYLFEQYVSRLSVNIQKIENDRDYALGKPTEKESICFRSIEVTAQINKQLQIYNDYKQKHLINNETT